MAKAYSGDLRTRVIELVETGVSRRAAAERFKVSISSAIRWVQRWSETGRVAAQPSGGSRSPLDEHADCLLALIAEQPDLTLDEIRLRLQEKGISAGRTSLWRFYDRHDISFKKKPARGRAGARRRGGGARALEEAPDVG